jgi:hypothetical protein
MTIGGANIAALYRLAAVLTDLAAMKSAGLLPDARMGPTDNAWLLPDGEEYSTDALVTVGEKQYGDINGNHVVDDGETAEYDEDAIGVHITDLDFGIMVMVSLDPLNLGAFIALSADIRSGCCSWENAKN